MGTPYPNVGAIQDQYFALTGTLDGFDDDYLSLVRDEILQGMGRQRVSRYPDREFTLYCLMTDQDLDWLSHYGATVISRDAFEVTPEAGTQTQAARFRLLNTVQSILLTGQKITQAAIAKVIDISQQAVSKLLDLLKKYFVL
jgi:predicted XRE-type DNA-binding protein